MVTIARKSRLVKRNAKTFRNDHSLPMICPCPFKHERDREPDFVGSIEKVRLERKFERRAFLFQRFKRNNVVNYVHYNIPDRMYAYQYCTHNVQSYTKSNTVLGVVQCRRMFFDGHYEKVTIKYVIRSI